MIQSASTPSSSGPPRPAPRPSTTSDPSHLSRGVRETIEAIAIAFALAFLFKTFEAEAFVIPTGSMAPTLMGRHKDVTCPKCGYRYSASASEEADRNGVVKADIGAQVISCTCPICRFPMSVDPIEPEGKDNPSYSGDRIWVSKVPYHFMEPRRWDVIVFRYPEEAETYYIKRLVGLPGETVKILHGDIYTKGPGDKDFVIQHKPPDKIRAMAQVVHDNDYVSQELLDHNWPLRWQPWSKQDSPGDWQASEDTRSYHTDGSAAGDSWLRYQHIVPPGANWQDAGWTPVREPAAELITDFYAFNTRLTRNKPYPDSSMLGLHWVGDLVVDCELDVQSTSGVVLLDLVKGGRHFGCSIDVASGKAQLSIDNVSDWHPTAETSVRGKGKYRVMFANVDQQLFLWVDDKVIAFDGSTTYPHLNNDRPDAKEDLAPLGIGSRGAALTVSHLRVLRDIYYIAKTTPFGHYISDYHQSNYVIPWDNPDRFAEFLATPSAWDNPRDGNIFDRRQAVTFEMGPDQFFVLGDNSPASSDARLWSTQHYVERNLLIGKALLVYWPHPLNLPIPFTDKSIGVLPNIPGMGLIR